MRDLRMLMCSRKVFLAEGKPLDWMKTVQFLANMGHFLAGVVFVVVAAFLGGVHLAVTVWVTLIIAALIKEYVLDLIFETGETFWSSTEDFLGYMIGAGIAWLIVFVKLHWLAHHGCLLAS